VPVRKFHDTDWAAPLELMMLIACVKVCG